MALVKFLWITESTHNILFCQDFPGAIIHINGLITTPACRKHGAATFFTRPNSFNDFKLVLRRSVFSRFCIL